MNKIAFLFPGQGTQFVGMGRELYETYPEAKAVFEEADAFLQTPFSDLIFRGPADDLTETKNSQLAIFIVSVAALRVVEKHFPDLKPAVCAGLSLGEYTALVAARVLTFEEGLSLVRARGQYMQDACEGNPGTMSVVLGLSQEEVQAVLDETSDVWVANLNCPGQVVLSGTHEGIEAASPLLKEAGAKRVLPLSVSGAFHSGLMQPAQDRLKKHILEANFSQPGPRVIMNVPGSAIDDLDEMRSHLIAQVTSPTYWQKGIETLSDIDLFVEMGPGKTLAGMNKKIGTSTPTYSIEKPADLDTLEGALHANA